MTSADLLAFTRALLSDDGVGQFLVSDNILYEFLAAGQFTFTLETRCFVDVLEFFTVVDQEHYPLPVSTQRVYEVIVGDIIYPYFARTAHHYDQFPTYRPGKSCWKFFRTDALTRTLTLYPIPDVVEPVTLTLVRSALSRLSATNPPEIDEEYHSALAHYAVFQCEHMFDSELNVPRYARAHEGIWKAQLRQAVVHYRRLNEGSPISFVHRNRW